jgi:hypothetical protein
MRTLRRSERLSGASTVRNIFVFHIAAFGFILMTSDLSFVVIHIACTCSRSTRYVWLAQTVEAPLLRLCFNSIGVTEVRGSNPGTDSSTQVYIPSSSVKLAATFSNSLRM